MAVTISEDADSRDTTFGDTLTQRRKYTLRGSEDDSEVRTALLAFAPLTVAVAGKTLVRTDPSVSTRGGGEWKGIVEYGRRKREPETGENTYQFEIGGGPGHVTEALEQTRYSPAGAAAPAMDARINVVKSAGELDVQGLDIETPTYAWSETHYLPVATVNAAYKAMLYAVAAAPVNKYAWRGFQAGEVKFKGASGQQRSEEDWAVTFKFEASKNATGLEIGSITGIAKKGWEYLWVLYEEGVDANHHWIREPQGVYVAQVYDESDFNLLGIGT